MNRFEFTFNFGGELQFHWLDNNTSAVVNSRTYDDKPHSFKGTVEQSLFYEFIMSLPKIPATEQFGEMFNSPDIFIGELVNDFFVTKAVSDGLKKNVTIKCEDGSFFSWKISPKSTIENIKQYVSKKYPNCLIMNDLSISEVITHYKEGKLII
jgi:hypothetical protein